MTNNQDISLVDRLQDELRRMRDVFHLPGILLVDTSWITAFSKQRVGTALPSLKTDFYKGLFEVALLELTERDIIFPRETRKEFEIYVDLQKKYLEEATRKAEIDPTFRGVHMRSRLVKATEKFAGLMSAFPAEAYLDKTILPYIPSLTNAFRDLMSREGVSRDYGQRYGRSPSLEAHKEHDAQMMATQVGVALSHPGKEVRLLTRDSDFLRAHWELEKEKSEGLRNLCEKHRAPYTDRLEERISVFYDAPIPTEDIGTIKAAEQAYLHECREHGGKRAALRG